MVWKESCILDRRIMFVRDCLCGERTMTELCERCCVSGKSGCKWIARHAAEGLAGARRRGLAG